MGRGNDAIPTWSGFNYQGKMTLLCAIEHINMLLSRGEELSDYEVEIERREDYALKYSGEYIAFYQVKAWLTTKAWKYYEDALIKLRDHRNEENPSASCNLVIAKECNDWDVDDNKYNSEVSVYKRNGKVVELDKVKQEIVIEIEKLLAFKGKACKNIDVVYGSLCAFLDMKVERMHLQGASHREYGIHYQDIVDEILGAVNKEEQDKQVLLKEAAYNQLVHVIQKATNSSCEDICHKSLEDCNENCAVKEAVLKILSIGNILEYCKSSANIPIANNTSN